MRLLGFVVGLTLGGLGLLVLLNPSLAIRARDLVVENLPMAPSPIIRAMPPAPVPMTPTPSEFRATPTPESPVDSKPDQESRTAHAATRAPETDASSHQPAGAASDNTAHREPDPRPGPARYEVAPPETNAKDETSTATSEPPPTEQPRQWHAIWTPFLTARAARGFADRLETLTGLEFTVIEIDRRRHQVAFAYVDAAQRDTALAIIEGQTGLNLHETRQ